MNKGLFIPFPGLTSEGLILRELKMEDENEILNLIEAVLSPKNLHSIKLLAINYFERISHLNNDFSTSEKNVSTVTFVLKSKIYSKSHSQSS